MKLLVVIPSTYEYTGICKTFPQLKSLNRHLARGFTGTVMTDFLVTFPGTPAMIGRLMQRTGAASYDLHILAGICGSYRDEYANGQVVRVGHDCFADLGAESTEGFIPAEKLGLFEDDQRPAGAWISDHPGETKKYFARFPVVRGITRNSVTGTLETRSEMVGMFDPDTESMEGAAFFYVCHHENLNFVQLRAVSNRVEPRNRKNWETEKALGNLALELRNLIDELHA